MESAGAGSGVGTADSSSGLGGAVRPRRPAQVAAARRMFGGMEMGVEWKARFRAFVDVAIRVPPLFVMDSLLARWNTIPADQSAKASGASGSAAAETVEQAALEAGINAMLWFLIYSTLFLFSFVVFLLESRQLLRVYLFLASLGVLLWSYVCNHEFVKSATELTEQHTNVLYECFTLNSNVLIKTLGNYILQVFLGIIFSFSAQGGGEGTTGGSGHSPSRLFSLWVIFIGPTFFALFSPFLSNAFLGWTPAISFLAAHIVLLHGLRVFLQPAAQYLHETMFWAKQVIAGEGIFFLLKAQWRRLQVPRVLRLFWLSRMTEHASLLLAERHADGQLGSWLALGAQLPQVATQLLVRGCETILSVMGMTSLVSVVSHYVSLAMKLFLQMDDSDERHMGTVSAILFFVLAMQSGLTGMEPEKRLNRLYQNVCLLMTATLHFFHSMINSLLQMLGASLNSPRERHIRALLVSAFLIVFPVFFMYIAWTRHPISTWLLALSCFSTEVVFKVIVSLIVYVLFLIDARLDSSWEPFDDYVYAVRTFGACMELLFGTFLLLNGAWIFFFEQGGTIRAFTILFHAYFNVWTQAKQGWANSVRRREAGRRLAEFRRATPEQLANLNDVCAICHHDMDSAVVTECEHFYHVNCLRRWLFMQNHCPLCHSDFDRRRERLSPTLGQHANPEEQRGLFAPPQPGAANHPQRLHPHLHVD
ncbi:protein TRC8-like [Tropilaelaps mercedesae]|uniref:Protein TRC8-like n=1 Tax=Tropilaelaps mercedesae TaxID=418985 RepID=A0A1V9XKK8_9ACAR|nr:protein TRC8-like [Tropilaelaps mercedesae]